MPLTGTVYGERDKGEICAVGSCSVSEDEYGFNLLFEVSRDSFVGKETYMKIIYRDGAVHFMNTHDQPVRFNARFPVDSSRYDVEQVTTSFKNGRQVEVRAPMLLDTNKRKDEDMMQIDDESWQQEFLDIIAGNPFEWDFRDDDIITGMIQVQ